jgi:hypothetical protein
MMLPHTIVFTILKDGTLDPPRDTPIPKLEGKKLTAQVLLIPTTGYRGPHEERTLFFGFPAVGGMLCAAIAWAQMFRRT